MKKQIAIITFIFLIISCTSTKVHIDKYTGEMNNIIKKLGNNYQLRTFIVNRQYKFHYEIEPDYFRYFSKEEQNTDVQVFEYIWIRGKKTIFIWAKYNGENVEAFTSIEYSGNIRF